jgi:hypothetical protein
MLDISITLVSIDIHELLHWSIITMVLKTNTIVLMISLLKCTGYASIKCIVFVYNI